MTYLTRLILVSLFLFPSWGISQEPFFEELSQEIEELEEMFEPFEEGGRVSTTSETRAIFVYLEDYRYRGGYSHSFRHREEMKNIALTVYGEGEQVLGPLTREIEDDQRWYKFEVPISGELEIDLRFRDQSTSVSIPETTSPVYISILRDHLFPAGVDVWTQERILKSISPRRTEIRGRIPIHNLNQKDIPENVTLHLPFANWEGAEKKFETKLEGDLDWMNAKFKFQIKPIFTSIGFLQFRDRYYPMMVATHEYYDIEWVQNEENPKELTLQDRRRQQRHHVRSQDFLSERYPNGLSEKNYQQLVNSLLGDRDVRMDSLIAWSRAIVPYYEEHNSNPERFLRHVNQIGTVSWRDLFHEAYGEWWHRHSESGYDDLKEISSLFLVGFLLTLMLFCLGVYLRNRGSRFFNGKTLENIEWTFHGFFWAFVCSEAMIRDHHAYLEFAGLAMWIMFLGTIFLFTVNWRFLANRFLLRKRWLKYLISIVLLSVVFAILNLTQTLNPFLDNTLAYVDGSWHWTNYPFGWHPSPNFDDIGVTYIMLLIAAPIYASVRHVILNGFPRLRAQKEALNAELNTLKTQISPHFFFNSLNTVYGFALTEESPRTAEAITKLSDLMRFAIYQGDKKLIPLETELEYLSDYIDMQRLRLNPIKHELRYRVDGEAGDLQIAPLLLITLIENAFKHGISMSNESYINIDLFILEEGLILTVENSIHPKELLAVGGDAVVKEGGVGLVNTRERLNLLYSGRHEWRIEEEEDRYFTQLSLDLR